jgi:hypothetical protein
MMKIGNRVRLVVKIQEGRLCVSFRFFNRGWAVEL